MIRRFGQHQLSICAVCFIVVTVASPAAWCQEDRQAIAEVLAGQRAEAHAAWWGFDAEESTEALQAAINSGARKVIVDKMPGPWIVDKIQLADDQEVVFEPEVVVQAKKGAFRGTADALFTALNRRNVRLTGPGATLRMHRADYDSPEYTKGEWRHVLSFRGCQDVAVTGLTLAESGGDGIYLGIGRGGEPNRNVTIRDVVCDRNYRQGISVISAENLLIEDCVLKNTAGTAPAAGIDFEPNRASERLVNCVMRRCVIEDNQGYALHIYARPLDGTSAPVSLRIEDCTTRGSNALSASVVTSCGEAGPVQGTIEFINCRFQDEGKAGIQVGSKPVGGVKLSFTGCTLTDPADRPAGSPIRISTRAGDLQSTGGIEFNDFTILESVERPLIAYHDALGTRLRGITGTITVRRAGQPTVHQLDQDLIDRWLPFDPVLEIPVVDWRKMRLTGIEGQPPTDDSVAIKPDAAVQANSQQGQRRAAAHRLRGQACYLLQTQTGDDVRLKLKHQSVGRSAGKPMPVEVLDPAGRQVLKLSIGLNEEAECAFTAGASGIFAVQCQPESHTVQAVASSHALCVAGQSGRIHWLGTTGDFYIWVPGAAREFGIRVRGDGQERVSASIFDGDGALRWQQADISEPRSLHVQREPAAKGEIWKLRFARPATGVLEDWHLELRGLGALVAWEPQGLLVPGP